MAKRDVELSKSIILHSGLIDAFRKRFDAEPELIVRAPGRVNLMGDHTDYTGGLVLPIALHHGLFATAGRHEHRTVEVCSTSFPEEATIPLESAAIAYVPSWAKLAVGVIVGLQRLGVPLGGARLHIDGYLHPGAGLASSAATEVGVALALTSLAGVEIDRMELARLCQRAEHEFAGAPCGLMDQISCLFARRGHAMLLDCRSLEKQFIPYPWNWTNYVKLSPNKPAILVVDSRVKHSIAGGEYAKRRKECEEALTLIQDRDKSVQTLRDLSLDDLSNLESYLPSTLYRRVRHVITENARVLMAADAMCSNGAQLFGRLMIESHASLRDDFEVSCRELDLLVEGALRVDGVYGARMTGGGFGGCVIVLLEETAICEMTNKLGEIGHHENVWGFTAPGDSCDAAEVVFLSASNK